MSYQYRQLSPSDLASFRQLLAMFGKAFDDVSTYQDAMPSDRYLAALLAKPHVVALVAERDSAVVGGLVAYVLEKFERERSEVYIYDLAVDTAHRRQGLATELIKMLKRVAKQLGAYVIYVQADHGDDPAIRLYESLGVREDVYHFDIPVD
jgi:aminoglycoside 3-N-acetyltransferase I